MVSTLHDSFSHRTWSTGRFTTEALIWYPTMMTMSPGPQSLPVTFELERIIAALSEHRRVVLLAPPGAGKSTLVPPALLSAFPKGDVLLLQPRRVAARSLARRLAGQLGESVGGLVGYQVRLERKVSARTRLCVMTEGILRARLQRDPELKGVVAVVLDEFHERSLDADLNLAFLKEVQDVLREDLHVLVMSATLGAERVSTFLNDCPVIRVATRPFPVTTRWKPDRGDEPLPSRVARAALELVKEAPHQGAVLCFLPGVSSIRRTQEVLEPALHTMGWSVEVLHGRLSAQEQDAVLRPEGTQRVILATNIAETSLTVQGVDRVVDSGLVKQLRHDLGLGMDRLTTVAISQASAEQRAGRAGRLGPGIVCRLWSEQEHHRRARYDEPEIRRADLATLVLAVRAWGVSRVKAFDFFEAPPEAALERAETLLTLLGAVDSGKLSDLGARMAALPLPPRTGRVLLEAAAQGLGESASVWAALAAEPRLCALDGGERVSVSDLAARRDKLAQGHPSARRVRELARQLHHLVRDEGRPEQSLAQGDRDEALCRLWLVGWPDRVCRRRMRGGDALVMVGGRGARLSSRSTVRDDELLLALDMDAGRRSERAVAWVQSASRIDAEWLDLRSCDELRWDSERERVIGRRVWRWIDLVVRQKALPTPRGPEVSAMLREQAMRDVRRALAPSPAAMTLLWRMRTLSEVMPELELETEPDEMLRRSLSSLCDGVGSFSELRKRALPESLWSQLDWRQQNALRTHAPSTVTVPSGRDIALSYEASGPPVLAVKVQELFGSRFGPRIADGRIPVLLHLLNPAGRPLQVTRDLESFWTRTWPEVRKEMRTRYPKHRWPIDPITATPSRHSVKRRKT